MTRFKKYGRLWYTTKREAEKARRKGDRVYYDSSMKAYYIRRPKKSFWRF